MISRRPAPRPPPQPANRERTGCRLDRRARRRPGAIDDGIAGCPYRGQVRHVEDEERQRHHVAEAGTGRCQATAQILKDLLRLRGRIPRPDQFTALVLRDLAAHHHQLARPVTT